MPLTDMGQIAKGLTGVWRQADEGENEREEFDRDLTEKRLERLTWYLWHGNVYQAPHVLELIEWELEDWQEDNERASQLLRVVREFANYVDANQHAIPNYGDRYRHGEPISTSFISAVNQVVSKRMVKKQQMRWTKPGAHLLLQVRTQVLNGDLRQTFCRWYPAMKTSGEEPRVA
jgi:hypothetical protein